MTAVLELHDVSVYYGDRAALQSVSLSLAQRGPGGGHRAERSGQIDPVQSHSGTGAPARRQDPHPRTPAGRPPRSGSLRAAEGGGRLALSGDGVRRGGHGPVWPRSSWLKRLSTTDRRLIQESLERLDIAGLAKRPIGELSGGQQQRAFLARALVQEPKVLLLDEPFTGVDMATREATLELVAGLRARSVTVLVSTHDLDLASGRFDEVILLNGRLISAGSPAEVFTEQHLQEAFGGQMMVVDGKAIVVDQCCGGHGPVGAADSCRCDVCDEPASPESERRP